MSQTDFAAAVEAELHFLGLPFARAELLVFVADAWPLIAEEPDVGRWAKAFLQAAAAPDRKAEAARVVADVADALGRGT
jgi:hypothetical protein